MHGLYEQTDSRTRRRRFIAAVVAVAVAAVIAWFAWASISTDLREQGAESMRQVILDAAVQCAAIEGSYPATLSYLESHYGVTVNHDDYIITYEAFASNVMPTVTVVPR